MKEPTPRTSRLALAGGALALLTIAGAGFVAGRSSVAPAPARMSTPVPPPIAIPQPTVTQAKPERLDRVGLLALVSATADAFASGRTSPAEVAQLAGRPFSIALPFGCMGPLGETDAAGSGWRYDADRSALRLQVASTHWAPQDWFGAESSVGVEAIEGFWVTRPWTSSETCPATKAPTATSEPAMPAGQTLAIAQLFREGSARQDRRDGEPYAAVVRATPETLRAGSGFRVRLTGQLTDLPGGGAIRCRQPGGPDRSPTCLVGATFNEIAIENPTTGETLARWAGGSGTGE